MLSRHYSPAAPRGASDLHPHFAGGTLGLCADLPLCAAGDGRRPSAEAPPLKVQIRMRLQLQPTCLQPLVLRGSLILTHSWSPHKPTQIERC